ncbi:MAG: Glutaredoxin-like protein, YruB-family [Candidatus Nomurabacteria bacterium GW2011_GWF2_43_8]|uniref:Glutaredoxin-like protein, YruB-family n=3 Tax=Candidatus Nomuraibacteriota TaxID=1752729 RepID=A0A0G1FRJ4_9BACT|nr:MAG: Glutaredoxin-like protein, YruB-family [Candidatus Nomurabacteria bacterium GW2011_GWA2_43_15]KKT19460.1 MAG: Glutaredoxin-like protein, YruB-family [Candidatus Nomurabacteria bacterium GW2011_GWB1_43_7]KKT24673.1 MAG: Glutaredoxin-like protein, YruB-family [Candidatus Nomurabacteria bacterium GW2011_GWF2_43_8]
MLDKYAIIEILENNFIRPGRTYVSFMKNVTIYSTPTCHFCHMAKEFFKANNVAYTEYDVATNLEKRKEMIEKSQQMGVPVIIIDGKLIVGFDKPQLAQLLGL